MACRNDIKPYPFLFLFPGYGDLQPETTAGQLFTIVFAVYGVIVLGIFIGIFGHAISEGQARTMRKLKTGRQRKLMKLLFQSTRKMEAAGEIRKEGLFQQQDSLMDDVVYVLRAELPSILLVILLAFILGVREGWSLTSTAYFAIMSASTTGMLRSTWCWNQFFSEFDFADPDAHLLRIHVMCCRLW